MNYHENIKEAIYKKLQKNGQRITTGKQKVINVLSDNMDYMLSASIIKEKLRTDKPDKATVYRILQAFKEAGVIELLIDSNGVTKYKLCETKPHHHMICTSCGKIINFPCNGNFWKNFVIENNFKEESHKIEIYGKCSDCNKNMSE